MPGPAIEARPAPSGLLALATMTGTQISSDGLDARRRRLLFRCWHRGSREMDLIMGPFADAFIGQMDEGELDAFEALVQMPDPDLYALVASSDPLLGSN